ncbi:MAG TPA: 8-amino-7-oxononanoate synthase [Nitrospirota bacterium]
MSKFGTELSELARLHLLRHMMVVEPSQGSRIRVNNRELLLLCSNDYLGLAAHPDLRKAASDAMERYGFGAGASRLVSGTGFLHEELERRLAGFKKTEAALLFNSGYAANTGIIPAVVRDGDVVLSDSLNHASIIDGCRLSKARVLVYRHKDLDHAEQLLGRSHAAHRRLIVTDGVFSMDGDIAPLPELASLAERYDALLMVDDAHGTGVFGDHGGGVVEHFGLSDRVHIQMGTLGKALGSFGAYVAGARDLIDLLVNRSRSFIFSTALPPAICAASMAALDIVESNTELRTTLWKNRERFAAGLQSLGIDTGVSESPIVPIIIGDSARTLKASEKLLEYGVYATGIRPPTVAENTARIRTTVTAAHSDQDIDAALDVFKNLKQEGYL